jgi:hypothetical protein
MISNASKKPCYRRLSVPTFDTSRPRWTQFVSYCAWCGKSEYPPFWALVSAIQSLFSGTRIFESWVSYQIIWHDAIKKRAILMMRQWVLRSAILRFQA